MHHHRMAFYWDTNVGEFLFPGLYVDGYRALIVLCLVLVLMTVIYEGVKVHQTKVRARAARERQRVPSCAPSETATLLAGERSRTHPKTPFSKIFLTLTQQAFVFLFHTILGYILMLSVMVYNGYVFLIVIFGMGFGYFLFGHISMKINMENIRARTTNAMCAQKCPQDVPTTSSGQAISVATSVAPSVATSVAGIIRKGGYTNDDLVTNSHSSDSGTSSTDSQSTHVTRVEVEPPEEYNTNITHSCRL